ncbi:MAG: transposase, partial [Micrococcales bacterium]|nr:transposase [Micrococcales bacterium]
MDLWGPAPVRTPQGHQYSLTIVDDHSRMGNVYLLRHKSEAATAIKAWAAKVHNLFGKKVRRFHTDGGGEFLNTTLSSYFAAEGIQHTYTLPGSPEQNGVAEARNKHLVKIARCLLLAANAPAYLWGYALQHAAVVHNFLPHSLIPDKTPHECWSGRKPDVSRLRIFGCTAHVLLNPDERRRQGGKLGPRSQALVFVGLNRSSPGWLFFDLTTQREVRSQDVKFDETRPYFCNTVDPTPSPSSWIEFSSLSDQASTTTPPPLPFAPSP